MRRQLEPLLDPSPVCTLKTAFCFSSLLGNLIALEDTGLMLYLTLATTGARNGIAQTI